MTEKELIDWLDNHGFNSSAVAIRHKRIDDLQKLYKMTDIVQHRPQIVPYRNYIQNYLRKRKLSLIEQT